MPAGRWLVLRGGKNRWQRICGWKNHKSPPQKTPVLFVFKNIQIYMYIYTYLFINIYIYTYIYNFLQPPYADASSYYINYNFFGGLHPHPYLLNLQQLLRRVSIAMVLWPAGSCSHFTKSAGAGGESPFGFPITFGLKLLHPGGDRHPRKGGGQPQNLRILVKKIPFRLKSSTPSTQPTDQKKHFYRPRGRRVGEEHGDVFSAWRRGFPRENTMQRCAEARDQLSLLSNGSCGKRLISPPWGWSK